MTILTIILFQINKEAQRKTSNTRTISRGVGIDTTAGLFYEANYYLNNNFEVNTPVIYHLKHDFSVSDKFSIGVSIVH